MGRKKQRRQNVGWFSPARRRFLAQALEAGALLTTIATNTRAIIGWFWPVKKGALLAGTATMRLTGRATLGSRSLPLRPSRVHGVARFIQFFPLTHVPLVDRLRSHTVSKSADRLGFSLAHLLTTDATAF